VSTPGHQNPGNGGSGGPVRGFRGLPALKTDTDNVFRPLIGFYSCIKFIGLEIFNLIKNVMIKNKNKISIVGVSFRLNVTKTGLIHEISSLMALSSFYTPRCKAKATCSHFRGFSRLPTDVVELSKLHHIPCIKVGYSFSMVEIKQFLGIMVERKELRLPFKLIKSTINLWALTLSLGVIATPFQVVRRGKSIPNGNSFRTFNIQIR
jgi:hypothetical protein